MRLFQRKLITQLYSSTSLTSSLSSSDDSASLRIESGMKLMRETTMQAANSCSLCQHPPIKLESKVCPLIL